MPDLAPVTDVPSPAAPPRSSGPLRLESDAALVIQARDGRAEAVDQLFRRHRPLAAAVARQRLRDGADVDDAVSEAFTRTLERLDGLRDPARFRPFLLSVVRSVASDRHRLGARVVAADLDLEPAPGDVEEHVVRAERSSSLQRAVASLPARQRKAVRRFYWDEAPVATVAAELGITVNATTQLLFRARAGLAALTDETCRRPSRRSA